MTLSLGLDLSLGPPPAGAGAPPFDVPGLPIWSAAVQAMLAGSSDARVLCIGDSTTSGNNDRSDSWPTALALLFPDGKGSAASLVGCANFTPYPDYDARVTLGTGWFSGPIFAILGLAGGPLLWFSAAAGGGAQSPMVFDPGRTWDTVDVLYRKIASFGGAADINVEGGATLGSISGAGVAGVYLSTFTGAPTSDPVEVDITADDQVFIEGLVCRSAAAKQVSVLNAGGGGLSANSYRTLDTAAIIALWAPHLTIINLGINDWNSGSPTSETNFRAGIQGLIDDAVNAGSDVLLNVPIPSGTADAITNMPAFQGYLQDLAGDNGVNLVDFIDLWTDWATANGNGWMADDLHPSVAGAEQMAADIFAAIWAS